LPRLHCCFLRDEITVLVLLLIAPLRPLKKHWRREICQSCFGIGCNHAEAGVWFAEREQTSARQFRRSPVCFLYVASRAFFCFAANPPKKKESL
jgi:hypothetical protein